jgi:type VI secretion system secreted protein Hcp
MASNIDAFLLLEDQDGEVKSEGIDDAHKGKLQIQNFSFGVEMVSSGSTGTGHGAGKSQIKAFSFDVSNSKASPILFQHACDGTHFKKAKLFIRKAGGKTPKDYYIWDFQELLITGFELNCGDDIVEKVTCAFSAIHAEYKPQKENGDLDSGLKAGWNVKTNKAWTP